MGVLEDAFRAVETGGQQENRRDLKAAYNSYMDAIELFMKATKGLADERSKSYIKSKVNELMAIVSIIDAYLDSHKDEVASQSPSPSTSNVSVTLKLAANAPTTVFATNAKPAPVASTLTPVVLAPSLPEMPVAPPMLDAPDDDKFLPTGATTTAAATPTTFVTAASDSDSDGPPSRSIANHPVQVESRRISVTAAELITEGGRKRSASIRQSAQNVDAHTVQERMGKLLLGEDMSGSGHGSSSALTISNSITNLSVGTFGEMKRLEPLPPQNVEKWNVELEWLLAPCANIIAFEPGFKTLDNGSQVEIMVSQQRVDIRENLPQLRAMDAELQVILDEFSAKEWSYRKPDPTADKRADDKWWMDVVVIPQGGLSATERQRLNSILSKLGQIFEVCHRINKEAVDSMRVPDEYIRQLPKAAKKALPLAVYNIFEQVEDESTFLPNQIFALLDLSTKFLCHEAANNIEMAAQIWEAKGRKGNKDAARRGKMAQKTLQSLQESHPDMEQTALETSKIANNTDIGRSALEAYSRVMEGRCGTLSARVRDVLLADDKQKFSVLMGP